MLVGSDLRVCGIALLLLLTGLLTQTVAQTTFNGVVKDAETKKAVPGATVQVQGTHTGTTTNSYGEFTLELPVNVTTLTVNYLGYVKQTIDINDKTSVVIELERDRALLSTVVVTAFKYEQNAFSSARAMTVASAKDLQEKNKFSALDALDDKIGVWIEKRTTSSSDPVIRGLSGANILALVDGQNFSTFWGEGGGAGDDMYGKIDGESLERIEVVRGPSSVMYGSNALGGVINFITKKSPLDFGENFRSGGKIKGALGSASQYLMGRAETWGASSNFKYFVGSTTHRSGNMRAGGDIGYINPSGGSDWSFDVNTEVRVNDSNFITIGGQYMNRPETYRSYRPNQLNSNERLGLNLGHLSTKSTFLYDDLKIGLYLQDKKDIRYWYTDASLDTLTDEGFSWWRTYGADVHAVKDFGKNKKSRILYGVNYHIDIAESPDDEQFTMKTSFGDQKAAPDTRWHNVGIYVNDEWEAVKWLTLSAGIRTDYFNFIADDNLYYTKPGESDTNQNHGVIDPATYTNKAFTGSAAAVFHITENSNIVTSWAHGFRMFAPSFGFRQTGQGVLIPNGLLDPATSDLYELILRTRLKFVDLNLTGYYTLFGNFQSATYGEYNGSTHIDYNNNGAYEPDERVYVNTPNGSAYVYGIEAELNFSLGSLNKSLNGLYLIAGAMYNYGRVKYPDKEEEFMRHTHPSRGIFTLRYEDPSLKKRYWVAFVADIVGKYENVNDNRLNSDVGYLDNPQDPNSGLYASYGLPSYEVFDLHGGLHFSKHVYLSLAIENILDIRYRSAHSRMDASGRNFLIGLEYVIPEFTRKGKE